MFGKITRNITILAAKKLLSDNSEGIQSTGKRLLTVVAGAYLFQSGLKNLTKHPFIAVQEATLGAYLLYDAAKSISDGYDRKPKEIYQMRKNQIQGNDPDSPVPAFV
ncbi:hypothetical protein ACSBL2_14035 [Pedobacter sp. AW31-3R]|uniref:hypothetical protein n=1 Tax=Pedobacter sp. AW31-3R TaxID=3445781 RepID=UPI003F9FC196